jgi:DNA-binding transcriptional ArsR family regulator
MTLSRMCKALGNADRIRLVVCLVRSHTVSELLEKCSLSQSALSQHLKVLREADLVATQRNGKYVRYKARPHAVRIAKLFTTH